jgi:plasmid replication initiation protein
MSADWSAEEAARPARSSQSADCRRQLDGRVEPGTAPVPKFTSSHGRSEIENARSTVEQAAGQEKEHGDRRLVRETRDAALLATGEERKSQICGVDESLAGSLVMATQRVVP